MNEKSISKYLEMKLITVNINSIRAHIQAVLELLESNKYDVILVQELKAEDVAFPHVLFDHLGYNIKTFGQKSWNGVAVFSKYSIEDVVRGLPNYPDINSRFIECVIDGRIRIINVYMPNGESEISPKFQYKLEWMNKFGEYIKQFENSIEPVIIGGDFNVAISDIDIWNIKSFLGSSISAEPARKIMREWLNNWTDCYRNFHPNDIGFTYFDYRGRDSVANNQGLRLDYFIANKTALKIITDCQIDLSPRIAEKPSDHCGLTLELE